MLEVRYLRELEPISPRLAEASEKTKKKLRELSRRSSGVRAVEGGAAPEAQGDTVWVTEDGTLNVNWPKMGGRPYLFRYKGREFVAIRREGKVLEIYELGR